MFQSRRALPTSWVQRKREAPGMIVNGNTILITGGGSGIGRALAEAFDGLGNQVIIAGRRQSTLDEVTVATPGIKSMTLDIEQPEAISGFAEAITWDYPALNVVIHAAGIMRMEKLTAPPDYVADAEAIVTTNLLGPIRLTAALLPHLMAQERAAVLTVSSGLAFVPMAVTPTYCASKAAIHSYSMSLRRQLQSTSVEVIEIIPPYVQTRLMGDRQANDPDAMPLDEYIAEVMDILTNQPHAGEIVVERCKMMRFAAAQGMEGKIFERLSEGH